MYIVSIYLKSNFINLSLLVENTLWQRNEQIASKTAYGVHMMGSLQITLGSLRYLLVFDCEHLPSQCDQTTDLS